MATLQNRARAYPDNVSEILTDDESDDDDNRSINIRALKEDITGKNGGKEQKKKEEEEEIDEDGMVVVKKKPRKLQPKLTIANVTDKNDGLQDIYDTFPKLRFKKKKGSEVHNLKKLLNAYEEWGHNLWPRETFPSIVERINKMNKQHMRVELSEMRHRERDRVTRGRTSTATSAVAAQNPAEDETMLEAPLEEQPSSTLADEAKERMRKNKELAMERLRKKKEQQRLQQQQSPDPSQDEYDMMMEMEQEYDQIDPDEEELANDFLFNTPAKATATPVSKNSNQMVINIHSAASSQSTTQNTQIITPLATPVYRDETDQDQSMPAATRRLVIDPSAMESQTQATQLVTQTQQVSPSPPDDDLDNHSY